MGAGRAPGRRESGSRVPPRPIDHHLGLNAQATDQVDPFARPSIGCAMRSSTRRSGSPRSRRRSRGRARDRRVPAGRGRAGQRRARARTCPDRQAVVGLLLRRRATEQLDTVPPRLRGVRARRRAVRFVVPRAARGVGDCCGRKDDPPGGDARRAGVHDGPRGILERIPPSTPGRIVALIALVVGSRFSPRSPRIGSSASRSSSRSCSSFSSSGASGGRPGGVVGAEPLALLCGDRARGRGHRRVIGVGASGLVRARVLPRARRAHGSSCAPGRLEHRY